MPFFTSLTNRLWSFVSPRRTEQRRERPLRARSNDTNHSNGTRPAQRPLRRRLDRKSMSPHSRVNAWKAGTPNPSNRDRAPLSPLSPDHPPQRRAPSSRHENGQGDHGANNAAANPGAIVEPFWENSSVNANNDTHVVREDEYEEERKRRRVRYDEEIKRREASAAQLRNHGWTEDAIALITKISMRGLEPLMPLNWAKDFETFPNELFTPDDGLAFLKSISGNDFRAMIALRGVIDLGPRVRDQIISGHPPERVIRQAVAAYNKWAQQDAGLPPQSTIPNLIISVTPADNLVSVTQAEGELRAKLSALADRYRTKYRVHPSAEGGSNASAYSQQEEPTVYSDPVLSDFEYSRPLPTLYGLVIKHTQMVFVAYNPAAGLPTLKSTATFDWENDRADVWNSLAVAIFVTHCRNKLVELRDSAQQQDAENGESGEYAAEGPVDA